MPKTFACLLIVVSLIALPACGGGGGGGGDTGGGVDPVLVNLSDCASDSLRVANGILDAMFRVIDEVNGIDRPDTEVQAEIIVLVGADFDGDDFNEGDLNGNIMSTDDISDGLDVGESLSTIWNIVSGTVGYSGQFDFTRNSATTMQLAGAGRIEAIDSCPVNITAMSLDLANNADISAMTGSITFDLSDGTNTLDGALQLQGGTATFSGTLNGNSVSFRINLTTFAVTIS